MRHDEETREEAHEWLLRVPAYLSFVATRDTERPTRIHRTTPGLRKSSHDRSCGPRIRKFRSLFTFRFVSFAVCMEIQIRLKMRSLVIEKTRSKLFRLHVKKVERNLKSHVTDTNTANIDAGRLE